MVESSSGDRRLMLHLEAKSVLARLLIGSIANGLEEPLDSPLGARLTWGVERHSSTRQQPVNLI
jgi:hypothetical protein